MFKEESIRQELNNEVERIDGDIKAKEEEIENSKGQKEQLMKNADERISKVWDVLGLPVSISGIRGTNVRDNAKGSSQGDVRKGGKVMLQELVDNGLIKNGDTLYFYNTKLFQDEQAQIIASSNKLKYKIDGRTYSISKLAEILLKKHGFKHDKHGVAGPLYWKTRDEKLLNDLNEQIRKRRGDRT
jgi:hypothetical protein